jgi:hypothetical protein
LQSSLPLVTGDCNGDGLFNANDATAAQTFVTNGVGSWPTGSILQMRNCAPTYSYMFNALRTSYSTSVIQITIADVAYLLSASTNKLFFLNISTPYDLVTAIPTANAVPWIASATYYYYPSSTSTASYSAAPCASVSGYFEMNLASLPYSIAVGSLYGNSSKGVVFSGSCFAGRFSVNIITNWQSTLNMSVGFINGATSDAYAFFGMDVGAFVNGNTNFVNVKGSTIVSGPIYTLNMSSLSKPPSQAPSQSPTQVPSFRPSLMPSGVPSSSPTLPPSQAPSQSPTQVPSFRPSLMPSGAPSSSPTLPPTSSPSQSPTQVPSFRPSHEPSDAPSSSPTLSPTSSPSFIPSAKPTAAPSVAPTGAPTCQPLPLSFPAAGVVVMAQFRFF